ncbi:hypothetical protein CIT26_02825 [Mesorhizobium temperatum]|uniref:Uncharacterized protein n=1 Tax=Mesorhizobium temperatum TaxID=241416 RepID=A0A271LUS3_9HYPH|nr:hypothetical protein CIT26_02825 [Mesorhizobium temperatum]
MKPMARSTSAEVANRRAVRLFGNGRGGSGSAVATKDRSTIVPIDETNGNIPPFYDIDVGSESA